MEVNSIPYLIVVVATKLKTCDLLEYLYKIRLWSAWDTCQWGNSAYCFMKTCSCIAHDLKNHVDHTR